MNALFTQSSRFRLVGGAKGDQLDENAWVFQYRRLEKSQQWLGHK